jgi:hypothetical protein
MSKVKAKSKKKPVVKKSLVAKKDHGPKKRKARPYEKLLQVMLAHGKPITKEEIVDLLGWGAERGSDVKGPKIYNISSYIWDIKNIPDIEGKNIVVKSIREGKKVVSYEIISRDLAFAWLEKRGIVNTKQAPPKKMNEAERIAAAKANHKAIVGDHADPLIAASETAMENH